MNPFSLWCIPERSAFDYFSARIAELAVRFNAPVFSPHITGFSGQFERRAQLSATVRRVLSANRPFSLSAREVGYSQNYFQTLYVAFAESETVNEIRAGLSREVCANTQAPGPLHLSLLYRDLAFETKRALAGEFVNAFDHILFDRIWLVRPKDPELGWRNMTALDIFDEFEL